MLILSGSLNKVFCVLKCPIILYNFDVWEPSCLRRIFEAAFHSTKSNAVKPRNKETKDSYNLHTSQLYDCKDIFCTKLHVNACLPVLLLCCQVYLQWTQVLFLWKFYRCEKVCIWNSVCWCFLIFLFGGKKGRFEFNSHFTYEEIEVQISKAIFLRTDIS